jgi:hypothetical protein
MRLNNNTKRQIDELAERLGILEPQIVRWRARKELEIEYYPSNGNGNGKKDEPDEFDLLEQEKAWYQELTRHGYTFESLCNPVNSDRVWMLYQNWSR